MRGWRRVAGELLTAGLLAVVPIARGGTPALSQDADLVHTLAQGPASTPPGAAVIPIPASMLSGVGAYELGSSTDVIVPREDAGAMQAASEIVELLTRAGLTLRARTGLPADRAIMLVRTAPGSLGAEGYRLTVTPQRITIAAAGPAGWFYGAITLWQLSHPSASGQTLRIDAQEILDRPRLAWRGLMLDSARHFQSPGFIEQLIDWMALHKLNVLQWHLTDDQGWRIEIRRHPELTAVGAWRVPAGAAAAADIDPATGQPRLYGGFYRQTDIRRIVAHALRRHVMIVPEIELPGHASAAIASLPALGVRPGLVPSVPSDWGVYANVYSPAESTFKFLEDVLGEVIELFPAPYVHIGGDEVLIEQWQLPEAAQDIRALGLTSPAEVPHYFTERMARFLRAHGKRAVGWDEILEPRLPASAVVMSWHGVDGARAAARHGNDAVLAPDPTLYFDHRPGAGPGEPPGRVKVVSVQDVYAFEPVPADLDQAERRHILGVQANLWTEHVRTEERVARMSFPRLAALAEVAWSEPARRHWPDFERRIAAELGRYRRLGLPFDDSLYAVDGRVDYAADGHTARVTLTRQADYGVIRYTQDGTDPSASSPEYRQPLRATVPGEIRAASFAGREALSPVRRFHTRGGLAGRRESGELRLCTQGIALALEDDAPLDGARTVFVLDVENPCWIYRAADLSHVSALAAAVGRVPFNFQIGAARDQIRFPRPTSPDGELEVRLDSCSGELYARLPLQPATRSQGVTVLPEARVGAHAGTHDLCLRFAQQQLDPLWALDWIELRVPGAAAVMSRTGP